MRMWALLVLLLHGAVRATAPAPAAAAGFSGAVTSYEPSPLEAAFEAALLRGAAPGPDLSPFFDLGPLPPRAGPEGRLHKRDAFRMRRRLLLLGRHWRRLFNDSLPPDSHFQTRFGAVRVEPCSACSGTPSP